MKQFKIARVITHNVWAKDEEEAKAMFNSCYRSYLAEKAGISILSPELNNIEEPWNWKEVAAGETKTYEFKKECPNEPCTETIVVKTIQEKDEKVIKEIREYLEEYFPVEEDDDLPAWEWDTLLGRFNLLACEFGDNAYGYYEERKEPKIDDPGLFRLMTEFPEYFHIIECNVCCNCGDW